MTNEAPGRTAAAAAASQQPELPGVERLYSQPHRAPSMMAWSVCLSDAERFDETWQNDAHGFRLAAAARVLETKTRRRRLKRRTKGESEKAEIDFDMEVYK